MANDPLPLGCQKYQGVHIQRLLAAVCFEQFFKRCGHLHFERHPATILQEAQGLSSSESVEMFAWALAA